MAKAPQQLTGKIADELDSFEAVAGEIWSTSDKQYWQLLPARNQVHGEIVCTPQGRLWVRERIGGAK